MDVLTSECREFLIDLHHRFGPTRVELLQKRKEANQQLFREGTLRKLPQTVAIRNSEWKVAQTPKDLERRIVEITGPAESKMIINALNSGADVFMADCEDSLSPTWANIIGAQRALREAVRGTLEFTNESGKKYSLAEKRATLFMRPRGWHLTEKNFLVDSQPMSASLFDFGTYFFHNAKELIKSGTGPYFYLPKMESHLEARLWNSVFEYAQETLGIPSGSVRATCLIETIPAAFQMEEILFELRDHSAGLNAGRWDYLFSLIKKFNHDPRMILPDRAKVTMRAPFMEAYCKELIRACHKRGAHAIGGMAAFIPNRREPEVTSNALKQVSLDKEREAKLGFDGTWVAHPDLIPVARNEFVKILGERPHQKEVVPELPESHERALLPRADGSGITLEGVRTNIDVCLEYMAHWLEGTGAVGIHNLMEDAATAEISRTQLWQWRHHRARLDSGETMTDELYTRLADEEFAKLGGSARPHLAEAKHLLDGLVLAPHLGDFLTTEAYRYLS